MLLKKSLFVYDSEGNLIEDKYLQGEGSKNALVHFYCRTIVYCALRNSKGLKISYDWRCMPIEFIQEPQPTMGSFCYTLFRLTGRMTGRAEEFPRRGGSKAQIRRTGKRNS